MDKLTFNNGKIVDDQCLLNAYSILQDSHKEKAKIKTTFGFYGIYVDDVIVCLVRDGSLFVKCSPNIDPFLDVDSDYLTIQRPNCDMTILFKPITNDIATNTTSLKDVVELATENAFKAHRETLNTPKRLRDLPNMMYRYERILLKSGIETTEKLISIGAAAAYYQVIKAAISVSPNFLYILDSAIHGNHWRLIKPERKEALKIELETLQCG